MEIGVDPRAVGRLLSLGDFVGLIPVAFGFPPEGGEERREFRWWA
jgi:hypothetical protein